MLLILPQVTETEGALTRTYFSDAHKKAAQKVGVWVCAQVLLQSLHMLSVGV